MTEHSPGALVEAWLSEKNLTKTWLALQLGVARAQLWRWLAGQTQPAVDVCEQIERVTDGIVTVSMWAEQARATKKQRAIRRLYAASPEQHREAA